MSSNKYRTFERDLATSRSPRKRTCNISVCQPLIVCILFFELCERLTFYSISSNFVRFCTLYLQVDTVTAINLSLIFSGVIYIMCIFAGWLADSLLGKFYTIVFSGVLYIGGVALVTVVTFDFKNHFSGMYVMSVLDQRVFSVFGLVMIVIATGGIKTTVGPFGASQIRNANENSERSYFMWLYWFINFGSLLAFTVGAYTQQNISFFYGYLIPLIAIIIALVIFVAPSRYYEQHQKIGNSVGDYFGIIVEALKRRSKSIYTYKNFMDYAALSNGGSYEDSIINGLKRINNIVPVLLTFIPFNIAYFQMQSTFLVQGERLWLTLGNNFQIPVASLTAIDTVIVLLIIPLLTMIIYPIIIKLCGRPPTPLQRIGFGLFLSALSMVSAGVLEIIRKQDLRATGGKSQTVFDKTYNVTSLSILNQIPQFLFIGAGEVFACTTGLEFAYSQAPVSMQSVISGLYYLMMGIGSFLGSIVIMIVNSYQKYQWVPSDIDEGHYEYFFFLLAGIILLDLVLFWFVSRRYKYPPNEEETSIKIKYVSGGGSSISMHSD